MKFINPGHITFSLRRSCLDDKLLPPIAQRNIDLCRNIARISIDLWYNLQKSNLIWFLSEQRVNLPYYLFLIRLLTNQNYLSE